MIGPILLGVWLAGIVFWQPRFLRCYSEDYGTTDEDYGEDRRLSIFVAVLWPIGAISMFIVYGSKVLRRP